LKLAIPKERRANERRVAVTPDTVKKLIPLGFDVVVQSGAGLGSSITDEAFRAAGAVIAAEETQTLGNAAVVLKVQRPLTAAEGLDEYAMISPGAMLIGLLAPYQSPEAIREYARRKIDAFAMELVPRITRAQAMDVLSSQANLAGYRAVLDAAYEFGRGFPMMMTAAGTIPPARVFVMGTGVAGLQAIATARRLGGVVAATDVRPAAREQVQSLGATFVMVDNEESQHAETAGGYAKEMSDEYKRAQAQLIAETIRKQDVVICTALIPGRKAPVLVTAEMVETMKPGSIIVDLAVEQGGNCPLSRPGEVVDHHGVKIIGHWNVPSRIAVDASSLYARNLLAFLTPLVAKEGGGLKVDWTDQIVAGTALTRDGRIIHPQFTSTDPTPLEAAASVITSSLASRTGSFSDAAADDYVFSLRFLSEECNMGVETANGFSPRPR
jgi:NAD(P) transhydrogenase subunit alpha